MPPLSADGLYLQVGDECYIRYGSPFTDSTGKLSHRTSKCLIQEIGRTRIRLVRCSRWRQGCWRTNQEVYAYKQAAKYSGLGMEQSHDT